jgi:hypothetical protein
MRNPRATSTGPVTTGADNSLGSDNLVLPQSDPETQRRYRLALRLDREADALLFLGRHTAAEWRARRAAELRELVR